MSCQSIFEQTCASVVPHNDSYPVRRGLATSGGILICTAYMQLPAYYRLSATRGTLLWKTPVNSPTHTGALSYELRVVKVSGYPSQILYGTCLFFFASTWMYLSVTTDPFWATHYATILQKRSLQYLRIFFMCQRDLLECILYKVIEFNRRISSSKMFTFGPIHLSPSYRRSDDAALQLPFFIVEPPPGAIAVTGPQLSSTDAVRRC